MVLALVILSQIPTLRQTNWPVATATLRNDLNTKSFARSKAEEIINTPVKLNKSVKNGLVRVMGVYFFIYWNKIIRN